MKESIHQEFERFMRDEMDDSEREKYIKSKNYQKMINLLTDTLKQFKKEYSCYGKIFVTIVDIFSSCNSFKKLKFFLKKKSIQRKRF